MALDSEAIIVAIDGGAGTGTSTVAKGVAVALGVPHLNTGSMYRALAWEALRKGYDLSDADACVALAEVASIEIEEGTAVGINGCDVRSQLYVENMGLHASVISGISGVRHAMVRLQRDTALQKGAVLEGRDIGTNVFPDAPHKFFFICSAEERVRRVNSGGRHHETIESLLTRDAADKAHSVGALRQGCRSDCRTSRS